MMGVLRMERFPMKRLSVEGLWESSFIEDIERYVSTDTGISLHRGHIGEIGEELLAETFERER